MRIHVKQLPCAEAEFRQKFAAYLQAREEHKLTVGVPAPWPEYEEFRLIVDAGGDLEIYDDPPPVVPEPKDPTPAEKIVQIEYQNPITHRALRELILTIGQVYPAGKNTVFYQRVLATEQLIQEERAKL